MSTTTYSLNRSLGGAIAAIVLVVLLSSVIVLVTVQRLDVAIAARGRANEITRSLDAFRIAMLNQETGLRGYLITGDETSLAPYRDGKAALDGAIARLRDLIGSDAAEFSQLRDAETAARTWQTEVAERAVAVTNDPAAREETLRIEKSGEGRQRFDQYREKLATIENQARQFLARQTEEVRRDEYNAYMTLGASALVTLLICIGIGIAINRMIAKPLVRLADVMRRLARRDLSVEIPGTARLNEVGEMARAVEVFKNGLIELDRTTLLRATADTLPALVGYVDAARRIGFLNDEFGRWFDLHVEDVGEVHGRALAQVFTGESFPGAARELEAAFGGADTRFEHQLVRRGLGSRHVEAYYRPHRGPDGRILGVVTLLTDITERKRMEDRLARQARDLLRTNEELEQFAYVASHDLKAPLRGIENLVSWIEEDLEASLTDDTRTNMELLKSRVRRLESLLDDLLAYSRAGRGELTTERVDTEGLVEEIAALVSPPEGFKIIAAPDLPDLTTAKAPLTQVFQNLIGNAIKHHNHPADGHIWVDATALPYVYEFTVTDDGAGIPQQFRERVFGMFQTLRPRDEVEGSGMGLAIVKKLVERVGGRVWLSDGRDGRGLTVHFTWPTEIREVADGTNRQFAAG